MQTNLLPVSFLSSFIDKLTLDTPAAGRKLSPALVYLMAAVSLALAMPLQAQMVLEEVLVFATKRTQNLQEVPVAVTAFSGDDLDISGIKDVFDLSTIAPGLDVSQGLSSNTTRFRIRSIGTQSSNFGLESAVGLYVDGVYRTRPGSVANNLVGADK